VVAEMNRLGILVDLSHVSDEAFDQAIALVQAPPIASHSSCRHFTPGFERNLDDARIRALAAKGGVIQINFGSSFLTAAANPGRSRSGAQEAEGRAKPPRTPRAEAWGPEYLAAQPLPRGAPTSPHVDHVVALAGSTTSVGLDFDGVGPTTPSGLEDVSKYPNLIAKLLERGHSEADVARIAGGNLMRVWRAAEAKARELQGRVAAAPAPEAH
jgi:membrane dipeptidase